MSKNWKLENDIFYVLNQGVWEQPLAEDIYCSAFGGEPSENSVLPLDVESVKNSFPEVRFSKFSVSPSMRLEMEEGSIFVRTFFTRLGKEYPIPLPHRDGIDYGFADQTWCYFSGEYYQIIDVLEASQIIESKITFRQYIGILNSLRSLDGLTVEDLVSSKLSENLLQDNDYQPVELQASLYPYQKVGYKWLKFITDEDCGCVLGDEMGLGKTLQVISVFVDRKHKKEAPSLVVAPLSLLENWRREINRFAPGLNVMIHHGSDRTGRYMDLLDYDVVITSYGATITDLSLFEMIVWDLLILDEAQNIKNPDAARTVSIKQIPHRASIAVTGTPFENHMTDIWSLLDFSVPGCLGTLREYNAEYSDDLYGAEKIGWYYERARKKYQQEQLKLKGDELKRFLAKYPKNLFC